MSCARFDTTTNKLLDCVKRIFGHYEVGSQIGTTMTGISKEEFVRKYSTSLLEGTAAFFVGAGFSRASGFVDWRQLLREIAEDMGLDVALEHDLIAVAQYEENRKNSRDSLNEAIIRNFSRDAKLSQVHKLMARLPIDTVWTTNYDQLLEKAFNEANKRIDVKHEIAQLAVRKPYTDVNIFKMHGDVDHAHDAILTKDDYECYEREREAFTIQLLADLLSKRFLFLGFSFTDPNIDYTFNRLRRLLNPYRKDKKLGKEHYCILRRPHADDYKHLKISVEEQVRQCNLDSARFDHRVIDMTRFGIQTVIIEKYEEITELLAALQRNVSTRSVMISGAAHDYSPLGQDRVEGLCEDLGRQLIEEGYDIVSGVGRGIGSAIMLGAHKALARPDASRLGQRLKLYPFPYWHAKDAERTAYYEANRAEMAAQAGVCIFVVGNKLEDGGLVESPGVMAEFAEALKNKHFIIPVGATGHAALTIWRQVIAAPAKFYGAIDVKEELDVIGNSGSSNENLVAAVLGMLNKVRNSRA